MNKLFFTPNGAFKMQNDEPVFVPSDRIAISRILTITEPTHIVYNGKDKRVELDAQEGDIVVTFYDSLFPNPIVIVNSKEWADNITTYNKRQQSAKEEWAAKNAADLLGEVIN